MLGRIFSIEEFSIYDGPGVRTSVFLKGCPMRCSWCHNPEGQLFDKEIVRSPNGCIECGSCTANAVCDNGRFRYTEASIKACPMKLLRYSGEDVDSAELVLRIMKNERMLKMLCGGVTFSGGEPLSQSDFLFDVLSRLDGRLHRAIQTSGCVSENVFAKSLTLADYFLYDLKIIDKNDHITHIGVPNENIINNFRLLAKSGNPFTVRIPLIPAVTDTERNISDICMLMNECGVDYAELLPYNNMAGGKYKLVGREYRPTFDEKIPCESRVDIFKKYGIGVKIL
jgi:pyruvate formate lyase activating enzyme